jgi:hypothetical protein
MVGVRAKGAPRTLNAIRTVRDLADQSSRAVGKALLQMAGVFPEFECEMLCERVLAG